MEVEKSCESLQGLVVGNVYLGIDYGSKRIGLSYADDLGMAFPLPAATDAGFAERMEHIKREISRLRVTHLILGYPLSLEGEKTKKCYEVDDFAEELKKHFQLPVELIDEGLTSQAADTMCNSKKPKNAHERTQQRKSGERDSRAAAILLQDYLNSKGIGQSTDL